MILQGFGMMLMEEAERIARGEHGSLKLAVISGNELNVYELTCSQNRHECHTHFGFVTIEPFHFSDLKQNF